MLVRYEDLVAFPEREVRRVLGAAALAPPEDLAFIRDGLVTLGVDHTVAGNPMRFDQGEVVLRRDDGWRSALRPGNSRIVTLETWPLLLRYGYARPTLRREPRLLPASEGFGSSPVERHAVAPVWEGPWPSVTVIIPTRDRPEFLRRAVQSVMDQAYQGSIDCLVVFDQEEPADPDVACPRDRTLRTLRNVRTPGLAGARNTGILAAKGEWVAFLDDDDEWRPDKLRRQVAAIGDRDDRFVATSGIVLDAGDRHFLRIPSQPEITTDDLVHSRRMDAHSSTLLARRDALVEHIGLIDEDLPGSYGEDYEFLLRASRLAPIVSLQAPLVRVHWQTSWFAGRWQTIIDALRYELEKHPELTTDRRNLSRMYGRMAVAYGALRQPGRAFHYARRSISLNPRQPRGYLAVPVALRLIPPQWLMRAAHRMGRGI
jgi:glycosyltransferase involved in cell wall biosynthesis